MTHPSVAPMITYLFGELLFGVDDGELLFGIGGGLLFVGVDKYVVPGLFRVDVGLNDVSVGTGTWLEGLPCGDSIGVLEGLLCDDFNIVVGGSGVDCPGAQTDAISCEYF